MLYFFVFVTRVSHDLRAKGRGARCDGKGEDWRGFYSFACGMGSMFTRSRAHSLKPAAPLYNLRLLR